MDRYGHHASAREPIEAFFARYTGYLTAGDLEALVASYHYPALAVTARGCLAITEPQQSRDFFTQGQAFYRSRQIQGVRARDIVTDVEVPGIWVGRLVLENLDGAGAPVGRERNAYQVVTAPDGTRRIAVSTPLDAYPPDPASGRPGPRPRPGGPRARARPAGVVTAAGCSGGPRLRGSRTVSLVRVIVTGRGTSAPIPTGSWG